MLSIQPSSLQKCSPNLLPARISHNGPINDTQMYWKPETDDKGELIYSIQSYSTNYIADVQHVHFRGRHLHGTRLPLPSNYTGAVLRVTDNVAPRVQRQVQDQDGGNDDEDDVQEEIVEVKIADQIGEFEDIVVWGHGEQIDASQDVYVKGMEEWIGFAEKIHVDEEDGEASSAKSATA